MRKFSWVWYPLIEEKGVHTRRRGRLQLICLFLKRQYLISLSILEVEHILVDSYCAHGLSMFQNSFHIAGVNIPTIITLPLNHLPL